MKPRKAAEPGSGQGLGRCVRALVQRRPSPQRHPLRQPATAPRRRRPGYPGGSPRAVHPGQTAQPGTLVRQHAGLVVHRCGHAQSGTRCSRQHGCLQPTYSAESCMTEATTTDNYLDARRSQRRSSLCTMVHGEWCRHVRNSHERAAARRERPSASATHIGWP